MKNKVKLFLASSINEFRNDRNSIGNIIQQLNDILIDYDAGVDLFECEFCNKKISEFKRKQEEYNEEIKNSDIFLMLIGKNAGQYTIEEYEVALSVKSLRKYVAFCELETPNESVIALKEKIKNDTGVVICNYLDINELKELIIKEIIKYLNIPLELDIENGNIML